MEKNTSRSVDEQEIPQKAKWTRMVCKFPNILGWDKTGQGPGLFDANHPGDERVIVPVQVLGTGDGTCNRTAWQTGAFYGNPLSGLQRPP